MRRIGFYGGRFNPIHYAHLILAQTAWEQLSLDRVIFMPSGGQACYKSEECVAPASDRLEMIRLAIASNPHFTVSSYEIEQKGFCYTVDTLRHFRQTELAGSDIVLLVGGDWLSNILKWKEGDRLLQEFSVGIFSRPGDAPIAESDAIAPGKDVRYVQMPLIDISSSLIRERVRQNLSIQYLAPEPVCRYIQERDLYR